MTMSLNHEILKLYRNKVIIPACCISYKDYIDDLTPYITIRHNNVWIKDHKPPVKDYKEYSHTYCNDCFDKIVQEMEYQRKEHI